MESIIDLVEIYIDSNIAIVFTFVIALTIFIRKRSKEADKILDKDKKEALRILGTKLRNDSGSINWLSSFLEFFDFLFGRKKIGIKFVVYSIVISVGFYLLLSILFLHGPQNETYFSSFWGAVFFCAFVVNLPGDYVSFIQTRWIIGSKIKNSFIKFVLDIVFSFFIKLFWLILCLSFIDRPNSGYRYREGIEPWKPESTFDQVRELLTVEIGSGMMTLFVFPWITTLAISIFFWWYGFSMFFISTFKPVRLLKWLNH